MSEPIAASGTVHWAGPGLSTGSGLAELAAATPRLTLWGRSVARAEHRLAGLGLSGRVAAADIAGLSGAVRPGDVVISMLPATEHAGLLRLCLDRGAHFACTSYTSPELAAADGPARAAGLVVLTEAGLDPGIDHLLAHDLVTRARKAVGDGPASVRFTSFCGGVPAEPNDFRYRFSWAPRGVLSALGSPARSIEGGVPRTVERPWEAVSAYDLDGEAFEVYPNRDSVPFLAQYDFPAGWRPETFVRGTLRLGGWRAAWRDVFAVVRDGSPADLDALAAELAARYPMRPGDRDRVVLAVELNVTADAGSWSGRYLLDAVGDDQETAMARAVSLPLAYGVLEILAGATPAGLHRALADPAAAGRCLTFLRGRGLDCVLRNS
ncbi:saccharopine dehydrogenase family protein [Actinoplanes sp. NPDC049599]|jgi:saccharopine dehydrogenase (NADP+, L-glutamate forming)|uniref:saccharopine dehydrogenase family protein n=1 Tax=Actinoplanes sp. NPDC049599 TaxID=3363903 RepID=UPI0037B43410